MKLKLNGEMKDIDATTVQALLVKLGLDRHAVAVELNRSVVPKKLHHQTELHENDVVELVTLVGGG